MSLVDAAETYLNSLAEGIPGLLAINLADRDGLTLARTSKKDMKVNSSKLSAVFSTASEQASKLNLGQNSSITLFCKDFVIVQAAHSPLVVTFIGTESLNVGMVSKVIPKVRNKLEKLREKVDEIIVATS
mmetsp:Transcript_16573/g.40819  ORF Transcript_16573/g.40819 Transcript_16573/m.40819 type:complete len:130 (-) Transcript_16573:229-618(-)